MKKVMWIGTTLQDILGFPKEVRQRIGYQLERVQSGKEPNDWKPMKSVGAGVMEIRIHTETEHRVLYIAKYEEAIYVLHAFQKKSQKTSARNIEIGKQRLKLVQQKHKEHT